jgi:hypothetical protein
MVSSDEGIPGVSLHLADWGAGLDVPQGLWESEEQGLVMCWLYLLLRRRLSAERMHSAGDDISKGYFEHFRPFRDTDVNDERIHSKRDITL